jgi:cell volume regulation protein A
MGSVGQLLVVVAGLLLIGALGEFIFARTGIPDVVWLVLAGILAGPVFEIVSPKVLEPAVPFFGAIALTIILSSGASRLRLTEVAAAAPRALLLSFVGFVFSLAAIYGYFWTLTELEFVKPAPPLFWILAGAIVGGSSSLILMPTLAGAKVEPRIARLVEVESSGTDAFCIVMTMVLIDLLVTGSTDLSRPFVALTREIGLGVVFGMVAAAMLIPAIPALRDKPHGYTVFLSAELILYALTDLANGNGAMAVVTSALATGNASTLVPKIIPGARPEAFIATEVSKVMQDQMTFLIKSFFFVLIGLMFPSSPRLIALGALGAVILLLFRIPAVKLSTKKLGLTQKQTWLLIIAVPRGLASGVLSTLPYSTGIAGVENFSPGVFALIVTSILLFAVGFALISRMSDERGSVAP